jgi:DNA repair exonuclease SbcCD ATPase subunit
MNILLKSLKFINFKGLKEFAISFDSTVTSIHGDNGTCKTTLFDGFTWLLFGKDSFDRKDFNIKTLDENNNAISKLEHEVSGVLIVDNNEISLRRVLKEKWTKRRGSEESEFTGNETEFYWNDVPVSAGDYQKRISGILQESVFKLITNPLYFNSLKWQDRRLTLIELAGGINDADVAAGTQAYIDLLASIAGQKTLSEYKLQIANQKKGIKQQLEQIPTRIDELVRNTPEPIDYAAIEKKIAEKEAGIKELDGRIIDVNKANDAKNKEIREKQNKLFKLKTRKNQIEFEAKTEVQKEANDANQAINKAKQELENIRQTISLKTRRATELKASIESLNEEINTLRNNWSIENSKNIEFNANEFICPTCNREFETSDIEAKKNEFSILFQKNQTITLSKISEQGKAKTDEVIKLTNQLNTIDSEIATLEAAELGLKDVSNEALVEPFDFNILLASNAEYLELNFNIEEAEKAMETQVNTFDNSTLVSRRQALVDDITTCKSKLSVKETIERSDKRKAELLDEEKKFAQQLSDLEGIEFTIDSFNKAKINLIESRINGKFSIVKFKLFDTQINGGEVECCEALVNGVPYNDGLNKAMTINAGLDIINTLSVFYGVSAPIWIDNAESVCELLPVASQLVRLVVENNSPLTIK